MVAAERLKEVLSYDPTTGVFYWRKRLSNRAKQRAGCVCRRSGYRLIGIDGKVYKASRLAWLYMTGEWPGDLIDHRNGERADDRWENVRLADDSENACNKTQQSNNTSGLRGVSRYGNNKWRVQIHKAGQAIRLNGFNNPQAAAAVYARLANDMHGEFAQTNRRLP